MKLIVDGVVFEDSGYGGNLRIFTELLPRLCDLEPLLSAIIITAGRPKQSLPQHERISHIEYPPIERIVRPGRYFLWSLQRPTRALVQTPWLNRISSFIWHSSYYTLPHQAKGPIVTTVLDLLHERYKELFDRRDDGWFRRQKKRCIESSDAIICISETTRQDVIQEYGIDGARVHVTPLSHSSTFQRLDLSQRGDKQTNKPYLLYVGGRSHYKNFDTVVKAYSAWSKRNEVSLLIVGNSLSLPEAQQIDGMGISDSIEVLSNVTDRQLCALYNNAMAFVYPSIYEGFGLPVLEAMASGCRIIASRIPTTAEISGAVPIYFEAVSVDSLLAALDFAWAEDSISKKARTDEGLRRARDFSWDTTAQQMLRVYKLLQPTM